MPLLDTYNNVLLDCPKCGWEPVYFNHGHTIGCLKCGYTAGLCDWPVLCCEITNNPCGTDTWMKGYTCPCPACQEYITYPLHDFGGK